MLCGLLLFAAALRLAFFNGFFGSDDLVYLTRSLQIAEGTWSSANYNGSLRYGYNIPAALFIYVFGLNMFTANAWTLFCSLAEVGVVYLFAARFLDRRTALFAALVLASMPLHMALGTRIHADAVLGLFLTLSFVLFYAAEQSVSRRLYFATGLSLGMIFWVKELGVITLLALITYPIVAGRIKREWVWVIGGGLVMLVGHLALMYAIAGDPFHLIKTVTSQVENGLTQDAYDDSAGYYFRYLFLDIRHTWIAPFMAVLAFAALRFGAKQQSHSDALTYVAWWLIALLVVLSFTPVSLDPLRLTMKQSNYLNLFMTPIALLSGALLARMQARALRNVVVSVTVVGGIALGAIAQHAYQTFTANSKAAVAFIKAHPDDWIVGSTNNKNMARVSAILERDPGLDRRFGDLNRDLTAAPLGNSELTRKPEGYAIIDLETLHWGSTASIPERPPECWKPVIQLAPENHDLGYWLLRAGLHLADALPDPARRSLVPTLRQYLTPRPATIYRVDANNLQCDRPPSTLTDSPHANASIRRGAPWKPSWMGDLALYWSPDPRVKPIPIRC